MTNDDVRRSILPLRLIFWGALLCILNITFSFTSNGTGFKFDILDDTVGASMIAWGVFRLAGIDVHRRYAVVMSLLKPVVVLKILDTIRDHFILEWPPLVSFILLVFSIVCLVAVIAFCAAMRWFCEEVPLAEASRSWRTTTVLFVVIYCIPLGLFYSAAILAMLTGRSFQIDLGPIGLLLIPVFLIPVIHLFVSTSRMRRAAEESLSPNPLRAE
jgi:hypothetical protein